MALSATFSNRRHAEQDKRTRAAATNDTPTLPEPAEAKPLSPTDPAAIAAFKERLSNGGLLSGV